MSFGSAIALAQQFATQTSPGAFPTLGISRRDFAHQLMDRVNSPSLIQQASSSLCGPAMFMFALIRRDPETYVRFVIDLYDRGVAQLGTMKIAPGSDCRNYTPAGAIAAVDWVALAGLRDGSNALLDYDSVEVEAGGITFPMQMASWFRAAGFKVENRTNLLFDKDLHTLSTAA